MRNILAVAVVAALAACGGNPDGGGGVPDPSRVAPPQPPPSTVPLQAGVYQANTPPSARALIAAGPALPTTLIVQDGGFFSLLLPGYDYVTGSLLVRADGSLLVSGKEVLVTQGGTTSPATIVGVYDGVTQTVTATVNGTKSFLLPLNAAVTAQSFTIAQMVGNYISTSTSDGTWLALALAPAGPPYDPNRIADLHGYAYASQADALASGPGDLLNPPANALYRVEATLNQVCDQNGNCAGAVFGAGFGFCTASGCGVVPSRPSSTGGRAYITSSGFVALTANPVNGGQFSAAFAKQ